MSSVERRTKEQRARDDKRRKQEREEAKGLHTTVTAIIWEHQAQITLDPRWIATEAMAKLKAKSLWRENPTVYIGCHLQLRQIARQVLGKTYESEDDAPGEAQHEMFAGLQSRYPKAPTEGEVERSYVLLEHMSKEDVRYNVGRLRSEARAKLKHADTLEAWDQQRG